MIVHGLHNSFTSVDLSTCRPGNLSPVTWLYMEFAFCCGVWGLASQAFLCESMSIPLNFTYIIPYDCPCFARMRNSFTSVDLSTCRPVSLSTFRPVNLSTCRPVYLSTYRPVNLSTCQHVDLSTCRPIKLITCRPVNLSTCQPVDLYVL